MSENAQELTSPGRPKCVYCQIREGETRDHVPPDGIFGKPLPTVLITVPACGICHDSFNLDDTYFLLLAHEVEAATTSDGARVSERQIERVERLLREGFRDGPAFLDSLLRGTLHTPENPEGQSTFAFPINRERLITTATRIIRGLYYEVSNRSHKLKRALPVDCPIRVRMWDQPDDYLGFPNRTAFEGYLRQLNHRSLRDNVFEFWYRISDELPDVSLWHLTAYGRFHFDGATGNADDIRTVTEAWDNESDRVPLEPSEPPAAPDAQVP